MNATPRPAATASSFPGPGVLAIARDWMERHGSGAFFGGMMAVFIALTAVVVHQHSWSEAGDQLVTGLQRGALYALIAVGYTMVYGIIELINFAHADVFALSAFYAFFIGEGLDHVGIHLSDLATARGPIGLALALAIIFPLTMAAAGVTGVVIERVAYRPLRTAPRLAVLITAIGVSFLLQGIMFAAFAPPGDSVGGNFPTNTEGWISGTLLRLGSVTIGKKDAFVVAIALGLMFLLHAFIRGSKLGKAMRATAQEREAALICGININRTIAATFFIGSALAGAAAVVYSIYYDLVQWNLGFRIGIIAFTAAVLGGIGNIVGAGLGGFLIGLISVFGTELLGGQWSDSIIFAMLILVLTLRPTGLLGMQVADRA
jgi:branched-chain amino acid transport system permease protein